MMPLWTTATPSTKCGWALVSFGTPWVAQRVWAMPVVPGERFVVKTIFQIEQFALGTAARHPPSWIVATPAES